MFKQNIREMKTNIYNSSHKLDTTAKQAIDRADKHFYADKRAMEFVSLVNKMAKAAGYLIVSQIEFVDKKTNRKYCVRK